jgi:hypothetical protein
MVDLYTASTTIVLIIILPLLYYVYYRKFRYFIFDQSEKVTKGQISRGKCPPFYPNGKTLETKMKDLTRFYVDNKKIDKIDLKQHNLQREKCFKNARKLWLN